MTDMTVAKEILRQLGGNKFRVMTGAKNFVGDEKSLTFRFPRQNNTTHMQITLNSLDLYDIKFFKILRYEVKIIKEIAGVYNDQLQEIFESHTGLRTRLF